MVRAGGRKGLASDSIATTAREGGPDTWGIASSEAGLISDRMRVIIPRSETVLGTTSVVGGSIMTDKAEVRTIRQTRAASLRREQAVYEAHLPGWLREHEADHVLIKGDDVVGFFSTRDEALAVGYARFGVVPLFVKQVAASEPIHHIPNVLL
jgi:hypothetical protein